MQLVFTDMEGRQPGGTPPGLTMLGIERSPTLLSIYLLEEEFSPGCLEGQAQFE